MPDEIPSGMGCPTCWNNGSGIKAMLYARAGVHNYYCRTGHKFSDLQELQALNPPKLEVPQRKTVQTGFETIKVQIPPEMQEALRAKYGSDERIAQTMAGILRAMTDSTMLIIAQEDVEAIAKISGVKPTTSAAMKGLVYQKQQEINALRENAGTPAATTNGEYKAPDGKLLLDSSQFLASITAIAKFRGEPVEKVCESTLKLAVDNGWI